MFGLSIPAEIAPFVAMAILAAMFVLFVLERTPIEVTAIGGATLMLVLGILPVKEATEVLANPAPWTIAMMFLVMGGMVRTGAVEAVVGLVTRHAGDRRYLLPVAQYVRDRRRRCRYSAHAKCRRHG